MDDHSNLDLPIFLRTTLSERIQAVSGGRELIPVTLLPLILPITYQTIRNKIHNGTFELEIVRFNNKNYVRTQDVVLLILGTLRVRKTAGRKSNKERSEIARS